MSGAVGAYGLRLPDLPGRRWLTPVPEDWPSWSLRYRTGVTSSADRNPFSITDHSVHLPLLELGSLDIDRAARTATVTAPDRPQDAAWVHPYLSPMAMFAAEWMGRLAFHAGSFLDARGRAWAVLGDRERGKSTLLAGLAARGRTVFGDDLFITDGVHAFAGPRCIDLRQSAAERFGIGVALGMLGARERWRVDLDPLDSALAPLGGVVELSWTDTSSVGVGRVTSDMKAEMLTAGRAILIGQHHALPWLKLLAAPFVRVSRPQQWQAFDEVLSTVLEFVDDLDASR